MANHGKGAHGGFPIKVKFDGNSAGLTNSLKQISKETDNTTDSLSKMLSMYSKLDKQTQALAKTLIIKKYTNDLAIERDLARSMNKIAEMQAKSLMNQQKYNQKYTANERTFTSGIMTLHNQLAKSSKMSIIESMIERQKIAAQNVIAENAELDNRYSNASTFSKIGYGLSKLFYTPATIQSTNSVGDKVSTVLKDTNGEILSSASMVSKAITFAFDTISQTFSTSMQELASTIYVAKQLFNFGKRVLTSTFGTLDTVSSQKARLNLYNQSDQSTSQLYDKLINTSLGSRSSLDATAELANRLMAAGVYQGNNAAQRTIDMVGLINKSLIAGGGEPQEIRSVLLQLSQGLSQGTLQGQELKAIRQYAPYMGNILAEGINKLEIFDKKVAFGDLKELGSQGKLTTDVILKAFEAMTDKINEDFATFPRTWGQNLEMLTTIWTNFMDNLNKGDSVTQGILDKFSTFVDWLQSADASSFWEGMTTAANVLFEVISTGIDILITGITYFGDHASEIISTVTTVLTAMAIVWSINHAKVLLVLSGLMLLNSIFNAFGIDALDILGAIIKFILTVIYAVEMLAGAIKSVLTAAFQMLGSVASAILADIFDNLVSIAELIDKIAGTDIASGVADKAADWKKRSDMLALEARVTMNYEGKREAKLTEDYKANIQAIDDAIDKIKNAGKPADQLRIWSGAGGVGSEPNTSSFSGNIGTTGDALNTYSKGGSVKADIKDEDIQLLRDIAAKEYLINVSTMTPQMTNNFGDVRETADINKIMDELARMLEEDLATSVVMG